MLKQKKPASLESAVDITKNSVSNKSQTKAIKLTYKEQRELEQLPQRLETLEAEINSLQAEIAGSEFFQQSHEYTSAKLQALAEAEQALEEAFMRWETLEEKQNLSKSG
ncbi:hypothetical protein MKF01_09370 [Pasteurella multocida]|nr:hypothetical protein [Pasteurella multocida]